MKAIRWIVNALCAALICMVFLYFVISLAILGFIVFGVLTPGQPMYLDAATPSVAGVLKFQLISLAALTVCLFLRAKIGQKNDFRFLKSS